MGTLGEIKAVVPVVGDDGGHVEMGTITSVHGHRKELDAGALFVLQSKGTWMHCGFHLTTSIVAPQLLSLPYAFAFVGWAGGIISLVAGAFVTFYSYNLLSLVLEHHAHSGRRQLRLRDLARDLLGPRWGKYVVGTIQLAVSYGAVIGFGLLGGQCMKAIYSLWNPNGAMKLCEFVIIFGALMLILAQMPSFHSLRHINLLSLILCLSYSICATAGSIYIGNTEGSHKNYSIEGSTKDRAFGMFNAIAIIATTFGNGIIPEIQATIAAPVKGKMFKGLCVCYVVLFVTFFNVAISGYWAFGNQAQGLILNNFSIAGRLLVPKWLIFMTNFFIMLQVAAVAVVYMQPANEILEGILSDPKSKQFSLRNVIPRIISRSFSVIISTTIAAMLPFFGDINAFIGAFGFLPLDFVLPFIFYNLTFKPSKLSFLFWLNVTIIVVFSILGVTGTVSAVRQIILDAKTYKLFANI